MTIKLERNKQYTRTALEKIGLEFSTDFAKDLEVYRMKGGEDCVSDGKTKSELYFFKRVDRDEHGNSILEFYPQWVS